MPIARFTTGSRARSARPSGFTLVEVMVVLVIVGVVVGISVPHFGRAIEQSRADFAVANLRAIWAAQRIYWLENHVYADKLSQETPKGLFELGLLDPEIVRTTGDYIYTIPSAGSDAFQAVATRQESAYWAGAFTIDQTGTTSGVLATTGGTVITPGFQ